MAPLPSITSKLRTALTCGSSRRMLAAEAVLRLIAARISVLRSPFSKLAQRTGEFVAPTDPRVKARHKLDEDSLRLISGIRWAVKATAPAMPFRAACLEQAMAARAMLERRGISSVIHFGAARPETGPLDAHAWLDASGVKVTGYPLAPSLTEIGCIV